MNAVYESQFQIKYHGYLRNILKWDELDALWQQIMAQSSENEWFIYATGETCPVEQVTQVKLGTFITEINHLLRKEHHHDYCGIVYVDNIEQPQMVKIYDPNNLGSVCGSSSLPAPLPGWVLSTHPPEPLLQATITPQNRRRWWQQLF